MPCLSVQLEVALVEPLLADSLGHFYGEAKTVVVLNLAPQKLLFHQRVIRLAKILVKTRQTPITPNDRRGLYDVHQ